LTFERAMLLIGLVVGMLLLGLGIYLYQIGIQPWRLSFCIGFGIILASFGSVANIKTKIWTITGAGAIAIILYWVASPPAKQYTIGLIAGDFPEGTVAYVRDAQDIPGGFMENRKNYRMVLLGDHLETSFLELEVRQPKDPIPLFVRVKGDRVDALLAQGKEFQWFFQDKTLLDSDGKPLPSFESVLPHDDRPASNDLRFIGRAWAAPAKPLSPSELHAAVAKLADDDYQTRRDARNLLVAADIPALRPVIDALAKRDPAVAAALDYFYVLTYIQRNNEKNSTGMRAVLQDDDFPMLIKGVASSEKEIRLLATEFLYGISDRRALRPSLDLLKSSTDQDVQWNAVLIIKSFYANLPAADRQKTAAELRAATVGAKTKAQIDSFI
jgi:hypothetical protein